MARRTGYLDHRTGPVTQAATQMPVVQAGEVRSGAIESLRALAPLGVFASHIVLVGNAILPDLATHPFTRTVFAGGASGVDLFFVLSGYLLYGRSPTVTWATECRWTFAGTG